MIPKRSRFEKKKKNPVFCSSYLISPSVSFFFLPLSLTLSATAMKMNY